MKLSELRFCIEEKVNVYKMLVKMQESINIMCKYDCLKRYVKGKKCIRVFLSDEDLLQQLLQFRVIWSLIKPNASDVRKHLHELMRQSVTQFLEWRILFDFCNSAITFFVGVHLQSLPRQSSFQKIEHHINCWLKIISSTKIMC